MKKRISIFVISLFLGFTLSLYPFSTLLEDYSSAAPLIGHEKEVILSEPGIMLFLGSALLGLGLYMRKKFKKSY